MAILDIVFDINIFAYLLISAVVYFGLLFVIPGNAERVFGRSWTLVPI